MRHTKKQSPKIALFVNFYSLPELEIFFAHANERLVCKSIQPPTSNYNHANVESRKLQTPHAKIFTLGSTASTLTLTSVFSRKPTCQSIDSRTRTTRKYSTHIPFYSFLLSRIPPPPPFTRRRITLYLISPSPPLEPLLFPALPSLLLPHFSRAYYLHKRRLSSPQS